jgi:hypothetical protein
MTQAEMSDTTRHLNEVFQRMFPDVVEEMRRAEDRRVGTARQAIWRCGDGWLVGYTTSRIEGGPHDGKFAVMAYKPVGKGARSGKAEEFERVYIRAYAKRKTARARADALYRQHARK